MKNKKIWIAAALIAIIAAGAFSQAAAAPAKKLSIDMSFTANGLNAAKDYFTWSADSKKINDKFDASKRYEHNGVVSTGASASGSTSGFDVVYRDPNNKTTMPVAVRHLCLFPVSGPAVGPDDAFTVVTEGNVLIIRFFNRGVAYEIRSDSKKQIDMANCAKSANVGQNVAGVFQLKPEFLKTGGNPANMADADWSAIDKALVADVPAADVQFQYTGKLTLAYKSGVLTMKGNLALKTK